MNAKIPNEIRKAIYRRDGFRCALCDCGKFLQIHHVIPRGKGGSDSPHNLITLCSYCHSHVHGHPLYETEMTAEEVEQACIEYVADLYAPGWWPWKKGYNPRG